MDRYDYGIGNFEYLLEWLAINCDPEVGDAVVDFVRELAMTPYAWPPEGHATFALLVARELRRGCDHDVDIIDSNPPCWQACASFLRAGSRSRLSRNGSSKTSGTKMAAQCASASGMCCARPKGNNE